jgi:flagellar motor switch protein FliM
VIALSEVLSQNEIDALLSALNSGEVDVDEIEEAPEKKVKNYDFRNPQKMAKDQLRTLEIIHDNFSRLLQTFLSGYLRAPVNIDVLTVDQYAFSEFSNAISNPAFLSIVKFEPLHGDIILDISPKLALVIIDRLLGGSGEQIGEARTFTEIEMTLLRRIVEKMLELFTEAWQNVIELTPSLEKIESNPQFAQIISPSETIALITLNMAIGDAEGMFNICIPHLAIEAIAEKLSTKLWFSNTQREGMHESNSEMIEERLRKAYVILKAEMGTSILTVDELVGLQVGDVIKIDTFTNNEARIKVGSVLKFNCQPGLVNNKVAVKITGVKKDGEEING